jgi:hypothetical protein
MSRNGTQKLIFLLHNSPATLIYLANTNFTSEECEQHFHLDASQPATSVNGDYEALQLFEFGALLAICAFMVRESTRERCSSSHKLCKSRGQAYTDPFVKRHHSDLYLEKDGRLVRMFHVKIFRFMQALFSFFLFKNTHTCTLKTD